MAGTEPPAEGEVQVTCRFVTNLPAEFRVPEAPLAVPANLTRYGLSQIVNHLLNLDPPRPFDFLVSGELLRLSLQKHLLAKATSAETVLEVEYVPAVLPPRPREEHPHDDWVSSLAALSGSLIASGCYDGAVRLWGEGGEAARSFSAHRGAVKAAAAVAAASGGLPLLLTGGADATARVWGGVGAGSGEGGGGSGAPVALAVLRGHTAAVEAVVASPSGNLCCTAGWDAKLLLWRCGDALLAAAAEEAGGGDGGEAGDGSRQTRAAIAASAKKRRVGAAAAGAAAAGPPPPLEESSRAELAGGHSGAAVALAWPSPGAIVSGSWDHSVRVWDVETASNLDTHHHNKAVYAVAAAPGGGAALVAFGGADRTLRLWDRRAGRGEGLAVSGLASHADWISALAWHPSSGHHLASASHDGTAKLWDVRARVPLHTLAAPGGGAKLLCVGWAAGGAALATGGTDCRLRVAEVDL